MRHRRLKEIQRFFQAVQALQATTATAAVETLHYAILGVLTAGVNTSAPLAHSFDPVKSFAMIVLAALWPPLASADAKAGEQKAQLCLLCHKAAREVSYEPLPLLEGQTREYLYNQLKAFKQKRRPDTTPMLVMQTNTANLSDSDMRDIADYFASRKPIAASYPVDPAAVSRGQALAESMKCAGCHMADYSGKSETPRLAGLNPRYLAPQLQAFVAGKRAHPFMNGVKEFSAADAQAVAHYLGQLQ